MNSDQGHSPIGGSQIARVAKCPGSVQASAGLPSETSAAAQEGIEAHEIAAKILLGTSFPSEDEAIMKYVDLIFMETGPDRMVEVSFDMGDLRPGLRGTADCVWFDKTTGTLYVYDFKYGRHVVVDVEENMQLQYYALGAMRVMSNLGHKVRKVVMTIVQPRAPGDSVKRWETSPWTLREFEQELCAIVDAANEPRPVFQEGDHCTWCPALKANKCWVHIYMAETALKSDAADAELLGKHLAMVAPIKRWAKAVETLATTTAVVNGQKIPGWEVGEGRRDREWADEEAALAALQALGLEKEEVFKNEIISVAEAEKLLTKDDFQTLQKYINRKEGKPTLVPEGKARRSVASVDDFESVTNAKTNTLKKGKK